MRPASWRLLDIFLFDAGPAVQALRRTAHNKGWTGLLPVSAEFLSALPRISGGPSLRAPRQRSTDAQL